MSEKIVIIVGKRGVFLNGIKALVEAMPEIQRVVHFHVYSNKLDRIAEIKPNLIILDFPQIKKDYQKLLSQFRASLPLTRILILVEEKKQQKEFEELGADKVLVKGFRGDLFVHTVRSLVNIEKERNF